MEELIKQITDYQPFNEQEEEDKRIFLEQLKTNKEILVRDSELVHLVCSALVLNGDQTKILMIHHNIYNDWLVPGGHADGEANLYEVAAREVFEETGVNVNDVSPAIFGIDTHPIQAHYKRNKYVPAHVHLNITYLFEADDTTKLEIKPDENSNVVWIPIDDYVVNSTVDWIKAINEKSYQKLKTTHVD